MLRRWLICQGDDVESTLLPQLSIFCYPAELTKPSPENANKPWSSAVSGDLAVPRTQGDWTGSPLHPNFPPNWSVKGGSLCTPALSHLLARPRETAWLPNGGMACSWPEQKGAGGRQWRALERLKTKQKKTASVSLFFFLFGGWWFVYGSGGPFPDLLHRNEPASIDPLCHQAQQ